MISAKLTRALLLALAALEATSAVCIDSRPCEFHAQRQVDPTSGRSTCVCPSRCPAYFADASVCGSDGITYSSPCALEIAVCEGKRADLKVARTGRCEDQTQTRSKRSSCPQFCDDIYEPVCGTDGNTYPNSCALMRASCQSPTPIVEAHPGKCVAKRSTCSQFCDDIYEPVCGTDGNTYSNECELRRASCQSPRPITVAYQGKCRKLGKRSEPNLCAQTTCQSGTTCQVVDGQAQCTCDDVCPYIYEPVCGSDGTTYPNSCLLDREACTTKKPIAVASQGECPATTKSPDVTKPPRLPPHGIPTPPPSSACDAVSCGYGATCRETGGQAKCVCPSVCPQYILPICGSDGVTYGNSCFMRNAACNAQKDIHQEHTGPCVDSVSSTPQPSTSSDQNNPNANPCNYAKCGYGAKCRNTNGKAKCECRLACTKIYAPVCGSDGKTYSNECMLKSASCTSRRQISVVNEGECGSSPPPPPPPPSPGNHHDDGDDDDDDDDDDDERPKCDHDDD